MPIGYSRPGPDNVSAYRMSGIPYLTASTLQKGDVIQVNLPYVSKFIKITNNETQSGTKIAFGVSASAHTLGNEFINIASGQTETFNIATKVFFLSNSAGNTTNGSLQFQACAGLTFIDEYPLWGDGVGTLATVAAVSTFDNEFSARFGASSMNSMMTGSDLDGSVNSVSRMSISYWHKRDATWNSTVVSAIISRRWTKAFGNAQHFQVFHDAASDAWQIRFSVFSGVTNVTYDIVSGTLTGDTWRNVLLVYDGNETRNEDRLRGYINGVFASGTIANVVPATLNSASAQWTVGGDFNSAGTPQSKLDSSNLDEVAVWGGVAISGSQINEIFSGSSPNTRMPGNLFSASFGAPQYWWRMGDGDTSTRLHNAGTGETFLRTYSFTGSYIVGPGGGATPS